jgi:hypothetical protein
MLFMDEFGPNLRDFRLALTPEQKHDLLKLSNSFPISFYATTAVRNSEREAPCAQSPFDLA